MKKLLLSCAVLALTAGAALAADLPSRKAPVYAPPPPPPPMWTGFYAGLNAGYGFGTNSNTQSVSALYPAAQVPVFVPGQGLVGSTAFDTGVGYALSGNAPMNQNGFIGGGQVGYNYQWGASIFVIGIEADMQGTGIRGNGRAAGLGGNGYSSSLPFSVTSVTNGFDNRQVPATITTQTDGTTTINSAFNSAGMTNVNAGVNWMGTVRGRLGYLATPNLLVFATGGLTYGGVYANVNNYAVEANTETLSTTATTTVRLCL